MTFMRLDPIINRKIPPPMTPDEHQSLMHWARMPIRPALSDEIIDQIDENAREVCIALNQLPYARTIASCGGHEIPKEINIDLAPGKLAETSLDIEYKNGQIVDLRYIEPYLFMIVDTADPDGIKFIKALNQLCIEMEREFPNVVIRLDEESVLFNRQRRLLKIHLSLKVPDEWCHKNNKPKVPEFIHGFNSQSYTDTEQVFLETYRAYFNSPEVRSAIDIFFRAIALRIKNI